MDNVIKLINVAMAGILVFLVVQWVSLFTTEPEPVKVSIPKKTEEKPIDLEAIGRIELYHPPAKKTTKAAIPTADGYTLTGIFFDSDNPNESKAVIQNGNGKDSLVSAGEEIEPGVRLKSVHKDKVVLSFGGSLQELGFPKADSNHKHDNNRSQQPKRASSPKIM